MCFFVLIITVGCQMPKPQFTVDYSNRKIIALLPATNCTDKNIFTHDYYNEWWFYSDEFGSDYWKSISNELSDQGYTLMYTSDFGDGIHVSCDEITELHNNRKTSHSLENIDYLLFTSFEEAKPEALGAIRKVSVSLYLVDTQSGNLVWSSHKKGYSWEGIVDGPLEALLGLSEGDLRYLICKGFYNAINEIPFLNEKEI